MEDIKDSSSGAPLNPGGNENQNPEQQPKKDSVSFDTHQKLLAEKKRQDERLKAFEAKEREEKERSGQFENLYQEQLKKNQEIEENWRKEKASFAYSSVSSQFQAEAAKLGCKRPDALEKLVNMNELAKSVGEGYKIDGSALKSFVERAQKEHDYLFAKDAPSFRDAAPGAGKPARELSAAEEVKTAKTQKELDAILKKHGLI